MALDDRIDVLYEQLAAVLDGASLCHASRAAGGPVPGVKYLEGGAAALREARRTAAGGDEAAALDAVLPAWRAGLERARAESHGRDWLAYWAGGVDAIESAREAGDGTP